MSVRKARMRIDICDAAGVVALRRLGLVEDSYVDAAFVQRSDDERRETEALVDSMFAFYDSHPDQSERDARGADFWRRMFGP